MGSTIKPEPIALVLCDAIYQDPASNKSALVGLFNNIFTSSIPVTHPRMAVFASVTGLREGSHAKLEILNAETEHVIVGASGPFPEGSGPLTVADLNFVFNNVTFPDEGQYLVRFWVNDHPLMQRRFMVTKTKKERK